MANIFNKMLFGNWLTEALEEAFNGIMSSISTVILSTLDLILSPIKEPVINAVGDLVGPVIDSFWDIVANGTSTYLTLDPSNTDALGGTLKLLYDAVKNISTNALLPLASLLLAFIFTKYFYELATDHNRNGEITSWDMFVIILRCAVCIELVAHAWDFVNWFWQLGIWFANTASTQAEAITGTKYVAGDASIYLKTQLTNFSPEGAGGNTGVVLIALILFVIALVAMILGTVFELMLFAIILTRLINFLLYCSFAPVAMVTIIDKSYLGPIGQNYFKNLLAFALQTFLLIIILNIGQFLPSIFGSMLNVASKDEVATEIGKLFFNCVGYLATQLGAMFLLVKLSQGSMGLAKSMVGAN